MRKMLEHECNDRNETILDCDLAHEDELVDVTSTRALQKYVKNNVDGHGKTRTWDSRNHRENNLRKGERADKTHRIIQGRKIRTNIYGKK